jgi:hypothetical protein
MSEELAEEVTDAIKTSRDTDFSHLATKLDLQEVKTDLQAEIQAGRAEIQGIRAEIKELELRMDNKITQGTVTTVKWIITILIIQVLMPLIQNILPLLKLH